jgi:predicted DNA binding CopG/RHH family protein
MTEEGMTKTTLRVPEKLWDRIRILAIKRGMTAQAIVIEALHEALKKGEK